LPRACECWQERKVREKSWSKGNQKGGREREKKSLVWAKKDREDQEKSKDRISGCQKGANGGLLREGKGTSIGERSVGS
jgi:hypothetical protein